jgi:hypothetical protein
MAAVSVGEVVGELVNPQTISYYFISKYEII